MKPQYIICLIFVFGFLLLFAIHVAHDEKRITKARRALNIPRRYHNDLKYLLFAIYNDRHYMYRLSNEQFVIHLMRDQLSLYNEIKHKLQLLNRIENMVFADDVHHYHKPQQSLAEVLAKHHTI